jgi:ABC-type antimicrobial peptide transport system permease subunit
MIRNYILVTLRSLRKNKVYAAINIAGLSMGLTSTILILLWVYDETSYDRFHPKADRIYQVMANVNYDGTIHTWGAAPAAAYEGIKSADPRVANTALADWGSDHLLSVGEKAIRRQGRHVTPEFLKMFEFPLLKGNRDKVLLDEGSLVISEAVAKALFGDADPIDQLVLVDNKYQQKVTGVMKDIPVNSSLQFDCLLPWRLYENKSPDRNNVRSNWGNYSFPVYVELRDPGSRADVQQIIGDLGDRNLKSDVKHTFFLFPMLEWRLYDHFENGKTAGGRIEYVQMFSLIAIFILVIACINFMNLATARSERRAREVGIRKSVGSRRHELVFQFLAESFAIALIAFVISVLLAELLLPAYNALVQKELSIPYGQAPFWIFAGAIVFFTGIVAGSYPAFYLSSFQPAMVLKGKAQVGKSSGTPRKVLVTLQFGFSILLILGTLVVYRQIQHVKGRDIGYDRESLITFQVNADLAKSYQPFKQALLQSGVVASVTRSNFPITNPNSWSFLGWPGQSADQKLIFCDLATEYDFTKTMGIKVLMGRDFSEDFPGDTASIVINRAALDAMGLKDPIGQELDLGQGRKRKLIGVIENTVMGSAYETVGPTFVEFIPTWFNVITVRLDKTKDLETSLASVGAVFKNYSPAYPFEFKFIDAEFQKKFTDITLTGKLANLFALLALAVTGLGLFGLASFIAEQRTKEIGIRKVLGASVSSIVTLLSKDFSKLVLLAFVLSCPFAWWMLNEFLQRYSYRIDIPLWIFPLTGTAALLFALIIVGTQALFSAQANPAKTLNES